MRKSYRSHLTKMLREAQAICAESRVTGATVAVDALAAFLAATTEHGRHDRRIEKLAALDGGRTEPVRLQGTP